VKYYHKFTNINQLTFDLIKIQYTHYRQVFTNIRRENSTDSWFGTKRKNSWLNRMKPLNLTGMHLANYGSSSGVNKLKDNRVNNQDTTSSSDYRSISLEDSLFTVQLQGYMCTKTVPPEAKFPG
jgi:hypothetical protein